MTERHQIDGHLIFVGLPGAGKSTLGRTVARLLGRPFLDFDVEIERRAGRSVARRFAECGESAFRALEVALTKELAAAPPMVLSPGGGWVTNPGVVALLRPPGRIIHLRLSPSAAVRRLSRSRVVRPLLEVEDPAATMQALWDSRANLYAAADLEIDVEDVAAQRLTETILALAHGQTPEIG